MTGSGRETAGNAPQRSDAQPAVRAAGVPAGAGPSSGRPALLDWPPVGAAEYAAIEDLFRQVLGVERDLLVVQGEAILALEAAARGLGAPGRRVLNLVTGPYGQLFGDWMSESGSEVRHLTASAQFDRAVPPDEVARQLEADGPFDVVALVHAEAATGVANDLAAISRLAHAAGALVVVDAVASVGAEPLPLDELGLDLVVLAAGKALAGPAGATAVVIGERAWRALEDRPVPLRGSALSLLDWRERWLATGRRRLPVIPSHLETRALGEALQRVAAEGLDRVVARHEAAAAAARAGVVRLGLRPWVQNDEEAAHVATLVAAPPGGGDELLAAAVAAFPAAPVPLSVAPGPLAPLALRIDHTGRRAMLGEVLTALVALAAGLAATSASPDLASALDAATSAWAAETAVG